MKSEWWRGAVIYQVYPRSFFDANDDGTGDLAGITRKLDYIADLGVDAIWISPFFKSPMRDFGYDVADYRTVDPIFGTNSDFNSLLSAAHERDLKVIIDMVLGHTSDKHLWFQESCQSLRNPKADWYVWADPNPDGTPPNNWLSIFGGSAWQWDARRRQYYLHHYLRAQPNLNWHNQEVVDAMFGEVRFWLDAGVDGLRLDAITTLTHDPELRNNPPLNANPNETKSLPEANNPFNWQRLVYTRDQARTLELLGELRTIVNQYDNRYLIGEVADVEMISVSAKYTRTGEHLHSCYNFELMHRSFTAASLSESIAKTEAVLLGGWTTWAMSNHDNPRVVTRLGRVRTCGGMNVHWQSCSWRQSCRSEVEPAFTKGKNLVCPKPRSLSRICKIRLASNSGPISRAVTVAEPLCPGLPGYPTEGSVWPSRGCRYRSGIYPLRWTSRKKIRIPSCKCSGNLPPGENSMFPW